MPTSIDAIRSHNWRQGSILARGANEALARECGRAIQEDACCIVISQSCDILHEDLESEPTVEFLLACPCATGVDGNYTHAKNARRLHFYVVVPGGEAAYEVRSRDRVTCNRELLGQWAPDAERTLSSSTIDLLVRWFVSRYQRIAFPDAFNDRLKAQEGKLKKLFTKLDRLASIYVALGTWDELSGGEEYVITLIGVVRAADYSDSEQRTALERGLGDVATCINKCGGLRVEEYQIRPDNEMTLAEAGLLARWHLDFISLRNVEEHVLPERH